MGIFIIKRFATFIATLAVASIVIFAVIEILPGNAAQVMAGESASQETVDALAMKFGLDKPAPVRYANWIAALLRGDMGVSFSYDSPIAELITERMQVTLPLALMAMALTSCVALVLGVYAASHHNRPADTLVMTLSQVGMAIPNFWVAILLILLFSVRLRWFSAGGFPGWSEDAWAATKALILPAVSLSMVQGAILARVTRSAVLEVLHEDFVRTARAKGLNRHGVLWGHVLRNAMIPVVTIMGLQFANLLTGTIVVENVFSLPGLGRLVFQSIANRDVIVVQDCVMLLAGMVIAVNFVVDLLYVAIDPRLKAHDV